MSSTNKTANIGLPQWEATDVVERNDFNEMLDLIDVSLGKRMVLELVRDVTPQDTVTSVYMDLSDLDFNDYLILAVSIDGAANITIRFNRESTSLGPGFDGSTTFLFPLKNASRKICAFTTQISNNVAILSEQYSQLTGLLISASGSFIGTSSKLRIWGVK